MSTDAVSAKLNNDVESLSKTTERLNKSAKRWQCWYFTALGLGVVLTIVGVFLQFGQSTKADAAINSYKNLMELKKQQSDLAIGIAKAEASVANQKAGEANSRAGVLEKEAAKLRAETALLKQQNLDTEVALTEAKGQLETEHVKRLEMEQALAPREIWFMEVPDKSGRTRQNIEPLRAFSGIEAIIDSLPDAESMRAAANIRQAIEGAGWKVISFENRVDINGSFFDGVTLEAWSFETNKEDEAGRRRMAAGERLETFLVAHGWDAKNMPINSPSTEPKTPGNVVRIVVGFKPNPFLDSANSKARKWKRIEDARARMMEICPECPQMWDPKTLKLFGR